MSEVALCVHVGLNLYASCVVVLNFVSQAFDTHNNKKANTKSRSENEKEKGTTWCNSTTLARCVEGYRVNAWRVFS